MCGKQKNRLTNSHSVSLSPSTSSAFRTGTAQKFQPKPLPFGVSAAGVFKGEDDHGAATAADLLWVRILEPRGNSQELCHQTRNVKPMEYAGPEI